MVGPTIAGEKLALRPLCDDDLLRRVEWLRDPETVSLFSGPSPARSYDASGVARWRFTTETAPETLVWAIDTADGRHIGDVDLHGISTKDGSARLTILIGDKAFWNRGYGHEAVMMVLKHAFTCLGLAGVALTVFSYNGRAIRCYEKCGFERTGTPGGGRENEILMVITRDRYMAGNPDVGAVCAA